MTRKVLSFAMMMVLAQRRHAQRLVDAQQPSPEMALARAEAARRTLQRLSGSKRLLAFTMAV